jgi:hypothetical protein
VVIAVKMGSPIKIHPSTRVGQQMKNSLLFSFSAKQFQLETKQTSFGWPFKSIEHDLEFC